MRLIVSVGWSIYPLGYFFGYLMGGVQDSVLNLVYNLADFVNKMPFVLPFGHRPSRARWRKATTCSADQGPPRLQTRTSLRSIFRALFESQQFSHETYFRTEE